MSLEKAQEMLQTAVNEVLDAGFRVEATMPGNIYVTDGMSKMFVLKDKT